jgi:hypothetical protein
MIAAASADSGPGAAAAARRNAPISASEISPSNAETRSALPGK